MLHAHAADNLLTLNCAVFNNDAKLMTLPTIMSMMHIQHSAHSCHSDWTASEQQIIRRLHGILLFVHNAALALTKGT